MFKKFRDFILNKICKKNLEQLSKLKRFYYRFIKIIWITTHNFFKHKLILKASALTYFSLMAIVPFFSLILFFANKIGYQQKIEKDLIQRFSDQKEIINRVVIFAKNLILETRGGIIALIGSIFLFWSLISVFSLLESSMNEIWGVEIKRKLKRRLGNYFGLMFAIPFITVAFISAKIYVLALLPKHFLNQHFLHFFIRLSPYFLLLTFFTIIYIFMPFAKVKIKYAFFSAFFASLIYQIVQAIYFIFQFKLTKVSGIYGSFAALPLFLIWLQLSWIIFLFGAQLSFSFQNIRKIKIQHMRKKQVFFK